MTIINFPPEATNEPPFFKEIRKDGYHVYSLENARKPDFYPLELPDCPGVALKDLKKDDIITIRVFFRVSKGRKMRVDGGHIDLRVEDIFYDGVTAAIITELPTEFALSTGDSIDVFEEEILYKAEPK